MVYNVYYGSDGRRAPRGWHELAINFIILIILPIENAYYLQRTKTTSLIIMKIVKDAFIFSRWRVVGISNTSYRSNK